MKFRYMLLWAVALGLAAGLLLPIPVNAKTATPTLEQREKALVAKQEDHEACLYATKLVTYGVQMRRIGMTVTEFEASLARIAANKEFSDEAPEDIDTMVGIIRLGYLKPLNKEPQAIAQETYDDCMKE